MTLSPSGEFEFDEMDEELRTCNGCGVVSHPWSWCEYCDPYVSAETADEKNDD